MDRIAVDAALLERALREGWPPERAELCELLARRPDWAALLEGPEQVPDALGGEAESDRRLVDEVLALARASGGRPARGPLHLSPWILSLAAALLVAVGWIVARSTLPSTDRPVQYLGEEGAQASARDVSSVTVERDGDRCTIHWKSTSPLLEGEGFLVDVRAAGEPVEVLVPPFRTTATSYSPQAWETAGWPERIVVRVQRLGIDGRPGAAFVLDSGS